MVQIAHFHSQFKMDLVPFADCPLDPDDACIFRINNDHSRAFLRELPLILISGDLPILPLYSIRPLYLI